MCVCVLITEVYVAFPRQPPLARRSALETRFPFSPVFRDPRRADLYDPAALPAGRQTH